MFVKMAGVYNRCSLFQKFFKKLNAYKKVHAHIHVCDFITILGFEFFSTYFPKRCFIIIHTDTGV